MGEKLTHRQTEALRWLDHLREKYPANDYGFHPGRPGFAAIWRRALEPLGLVHVNRISDNHFRYSITDAGRSALARTSSEDGGGRDD